MIQMKPNTAERSVLLWMQSGAVEGKEVTGISGSGAWSRNPFHDEENPDYNPVQLQGKRKCSVWEYYSWWMISGSSELKKISAAFHHWRESWRTTKTFFGLQSAGGHVLLWSSIHPVQGRGGSWSEGAPWTHCQSVAGVTHWNRLTLWPSG